MHLILSIAGLDFSGLEGLIIILFILGIALVVIEMVMPGIGAAGILGIISDSRGYTGGTGCFIHCFNINNTGCASHYYRYACMAV